MEKVWNGRRIYVLPKNSYHYCGYDNNYEETITGYTYIRDPEPGDHLDAPVNYIELREDVEILNVDEDGVDVEWDADKECPIYYSEELEEELK